MSNYIGAIDQGTTSKRFIVSDRSGRIVSVAQKEHEQIFPQPGWGEHDGAEIWRRTQEVIAEALKQRGLRASDLAAIGITNQRETNGGVGSQHRPSGQQRAGLAGHARRSICRRTGARRRPRSLSGQNRPTPGPLISAGSRFAGFWITSAAFESAPRPGRFCSATSTPFFSGISRVDRETAFM